LRLDFLLMINKVQDKGMLIEDIGMLLEYRADLTPLAARIYATLLISSNEGLTFDEIIELVQASKSTVSHNLNILIQLHYVEYFTKPGDRKRYFRTSRLYVQNALEQYMALLNKEMEIINRVDTYNKGYNPKRFNDEKRDRMLFREYLNNERNLIKVKIQEINRFQKQS